ncbi:hypothetical protein NL676_004986 [Syzygium grande]|nr:hypothetical protein NL676_004986 [Syzygium grande]
MLTVVRVFLGVAAMGVWSGWLGRRREVLESSEFACWMPERLWDLLKRTKQRVLAVDGNSACVGLKQDDAMVRLVTRCVGVFTGLRGYAAWTRLAAVKLLVAEEPRWNVEA